MVDQGLLPEVFSLWNGPGEQAWPVESFRTSGTSAGFKTPAGLPTFRLDLPGDSQAAARYLDRLYAQLQDSTAILDSVLARLEDLITRHQNQVGIPAEVWASALPGPEAEVVCLVAEINGRTRMDYGAGSRLGLRGTPVVDLDRTVSQFQGNASWLLQLIRNYAWVETLVQGAPINRAVIRPGGTADILLAQFSPSDLFEVHQRSLALAVASRNFFLRMFRIVFQGAGKLSSLLAPSPSAAFLALPVAWWFANRLCSRIHS